jgi:hypothetical protein
MAGVMEARGQILQVRAKQFKHEALDCLDASLCSVCDVVLTAFTAVTKQPESE